jgi:type II secretory pathway pseudopilin PulG
VKSLQIERRPYRTGFTQIEILVTIGLISLLIALLLPAIQAARERSRMVSCLNNLRQIGVAYQSMESTHRAFPPLLNRDPRLPQQWNDLSKFNVKSAHYYMLPGLEQKSVYESIVLDNDVWTGNDPIQSSLNQAVLDMYVPVFVCPSNNVGQGGVSYLICYGTSSSGESTPGHQPPNTVLPGVANGVSSNMIADGLSNTVAFSERLTGDQDSERYNPSRDWAYIDSLSQAIESTSPLLPDMMQHLCRRDVRMEQQHASYNGSGWLFGRLGVTGYNHVLTPNSTTADCATPGGGVGAYSARSRHFQGVHALFCDGSTRFWSESVDTSVWRAVGTISGDEVGE